MSDMRELRCGHMTNGQARCGRCDTCWTCCLGHEVAQPVQRSREIIGRIPRRSSSDIGTWQARYEKWWLGKMCRLTANGLCDGARFRKVVEVRLVGPPSFVYGCAWLVYEDGTEDSIIGMVDRGEGYYRRYESAFRPRKCDVEVQMPAAASPNAARIDADKVL